MKFRNQILCILTLMLLASPAFAHPHVFIDYTAKITADSEKISQIDITLDYDSIASQGFIEDFDDDESGDLSKAEIKTLLDIQNRAMAKSDHYLTSMVGKQNAWLGTPKLTDFSVIDGFARFNMRIRTRIPLTELQSRQLEIYLEDPAMYIAFAPSSHEDAEPVVLPPANVSSQTAPAIQCKLVTDPNAIIISLPNQSSAASKQMTALDKLRSWQIKYNRYVRDIMDAIREMTTGWKGVLLFLAAIALGFGHAAAPGHGKSLAAAYFANRSAKKIQPFLFGSLLALTHTGTAVALTAILNFFKTSDTKNTQQTLVNDINFYISIVIIIVGLVMLTLALIKCFSHKKSHESHYAPKVAGKGLFAVAIAGGLIPCPLSVLILTTAISTNMYGTGLIIVSGIAIGTALLISLAGLFVLLGRKKVLDQIDKKAYSHKLFAKFTALVAAGLVLLLGSGLLTLYAPTSVSNYLLDKKAVVVSAELDFSLENDVQTEIPQDEDENDLDEPVPGEDPLNPEDEIF